PTLFRSVESFLFGIDVDVEVGIRLVEVVNADVLSFSGCGEQRTLHARLPDRGVGEEHEDFGHARNVAAEARRIRVPYSDLLAASRAAAGPVRGLRWP